jgi:hypothetical protein
LDNGAFFALGAVSLVVVGYFLYQQQEDTQILLAKAVAPPPSKGFFSELLDVGKTIGSVVSLL